MHATITTFCWKGVLFWLVLVFQTELFFKGQQTTQILSEIAKKKWESETIPEKVSLTVNQWDLVTMGMGIKLAMHILCYEFQKVDTYFSLLYKISHLDKWLACSAWFKGFTDKSVQKRNVIEQIKLFSNVENLVCVVCVCVCVGGCPSINNIGGQLSSSPPPPQVCPAQPEGLPQWQQDSPV